MGSENQTGMDDLTPTQPWDLGKPPNLPQSAIPHMGKGNRARHHENENGQARGDTPWTFVSSCFLILPQTGPNNIHARRDGTA